MKTRLLLVMGALALSIFITLSSSAFISHVITRLESMLDQATAAKAAEEADKAALIMREMLAFSEEKACILEMIAPHESVRALISNICEAEGALESGEFSEFQTAASVLREALRQLRDHERITLSNIL